MRTLSCFCLNGLGKILPQFTFSGIFRRLFNEQTTSAVSGKQQDAPRGVLYAI